MEQQEGFGAEDSSKVCKLVKSLYGLKQAPRLDGMQESMNFGLEHLDFRECVR
jgi:hypothetical protein